MDSELQQASVKVRSMSSSLPGSGFVNTLRETSDLINHLNIHNLDEDVNKFITFLSVFSDGLLNSYSVYRKMTDSCEEDLEMLKAILAFQCAFLNERFLQALKEFDVPSEHFGSLLVKFGNVASSADQTEIRLGFQAWKFVSQFLSLFHVVVKQALIENFDSDTEAPMSDEFIRCMLLSAKRIFSECVVDTEKHLTTKSGEPIWRNKLKLAAFICRLIVGCVKQFQSVLFRTKETCQHRCIVDFISWAIEVQYAGGLFTAGTGLDADFLKEVSTSLFVATEMALSCLCQIESDPTLNVSAAANAIVSANLAPLVNCRTFASVLVNLSNRRDEKSFQSWLSDNFSAYAQIFTNLEAAFSSWKPYEITPKLSDFHVPRFLNLKIDQSKLSSAVEEFLTEITIEICRSVRCLPNSVFPYLESALLDTTLHASPVISLIAQDVWCFVVRYGSADLCWQYVTLLAGVIMCLAERYEAGASGGCPPCGVLEQMSRLGCLLSRFIVFLTARQQREFLSTFPLFDSLGRGATEKSLLWRFLVVGSSQLQASIRPLVERQVFERVNFLLTQPKSPAWLIDALVCLRLTEDLPPASLVPFSTSLAHLCAAAATYDVDPTPPLTAPPSLLRQIDVSARIQTITVVVSKWFPRLLYLATADGHDDLTTESRELIQLLLNQLKLSCRDGLALPAIDAISRWVLACGPKGSDQSNSLSYPLSSFSLASLRGPLSPLPSSHRWLSAVWSPLCQTELTSNCGLTRLVVENLKTKLQEFCPGIGDQKRPRTPSTDATGLTDSVDACLVKLAETIACLERASDGFTDSHVARGSELGRRLASLFRKISD